jgi:hypothetical protein
MSYPTRHGTVPPGYEAPHRSVCATSRARAGQWRAARAEGGTDHPAMGRSSLTRARETAGRAFVAVAQPPWPHDQALSASACGVHPSAAPAPDQSRSLVRVASESRHAPLSQRSAAQHSTAQHSTASSQPAVCARRKRGHWMRVAVWIRAALGRTGEPARAQSAALRVDVGHKAGACYCGPQPHPL